MTSTQQTAVREAIDGLIAAGTTFDIDQLDRIYHDSLTVLMIDPTGSVAEMAKSDFTDMFRSKLDAGDPPLNTDARFLHVSADDHSGHVIIERTVALGDTDQDITLSIDLIFEDERWQVVREVIFTNAAGPSD